MRILIVAATKEEVGDLIAAFQFESQKSKVESFDCLSTTSALQLATHNLQLIITGVGMVATAFALGSQLALHEYDLVLNLGIAGSFDRNIPLGEVVEVIQDQLSELGAENDSEFIPLETLGFGESIFKPINEAPHSPLPALNIRKVKAITVNTVHGNEQSIKTIQQRTRVQLESMEGAAVFYACHKQSIPCLQIRAVSNYVEKRNRDAWKIGLAIKNLNNFAVDLLNEL